MSLKYVIRKLPINVNGTPDHHNKQVMHMQMISLSPE